MAHQAQQEFFYKVKQKYPQYFKDSSVLDCGSLNVNGSFKGIFENCNYTGIDIVAGKDVDHVCKTHEYKPSTQFDAVVSGEMLEHDEYWKLSLKNMYNLCKSGGLIAISCAGKDRPEHGTRRTDGNEWGTGDYYMNLEPEHFKEIYKDDMFTDIHFEENEKSKDTYFYGIVK